MSALSRWFLWTEEGKQVCVEKRERERDGDTWDQTCGAKKVNAIERDKLNTSKRFRWSLGYQTAWKWGPHGSLSPLARLCHKKTKIWDKYYWTTWEPGRSDIVPKLGGPANQEPGLILHFWVKIGSSENQSQTKDEIKLISIPFLIIIYAKLFSFCGYSRA